jgi:hypothetical protein
MAAMSTRNFFRHNRFSVKLSGGLERRHGAGSWLAFSSPLLATLPDCTKMQSGFLLSESRPAGAEKPAIVNIASIHF